MLNTKQKLQKEQNWERGLVAIAECMKTLGFGKCGIFLVNPVKKTLEYHFGKGVEPSDLSISLEDTEYVGVKCVLEKKTIYVKELNLQKGRPLIDWNSFVWVPIIVQNEAFAALAAGSKTKLVADEDVKDLEILAGMCGIFIDRTRLLVESIPEKTLKTEIKYWLEPAEGYIIVEKKPEKSFELFCDLVTHGIPGFVISRNHPDKIKRKYQLLKTPVLWLSRLKMESTLHPDSFSKLIYVVQDFTRKSEESVILLDGLEYLITQIDFNTVLVYLQELRDIIVMNNSRLIIPLHKDVLSLKEYSILEKEFKVL